MSAQSRCLHVIILAGSLSCFAAVATAQQEAPPPPPIPDNATPRATPPATEDAAASDRSTDPLPPKVVDEEIEPSVTIRKEGGKTYEEYRFDGRIYMIKVTPPGGPPYYLFDTDGDGNLETHSDDQRSQPVKPVYWKLKEW